MQIIPVPKEFVADSSMVKVYKVRHYLLLHHLFSTYLSSIVHSSVAGIDQSDYTVLSDPNAPRMVGIDNGGIGKRTCF
jgi:hypothetical protein